MILAKTSGIKAFFRCGLSRGCIQTILFFLHQFLIGGILCLKLTVSGQRYILVNQDILNFSDIYIMGGGPVHDRNSGGYASALTGTNALRDQIQPVDSHIVCGQMASGCQQVFDLLRQNGSVRDLNRTTVVNLANGGVPCDNIIMLFDMLPL